MLKPVERWGLWKGYASEDERQGKGWTVPWCVDTPGLNLGLEEFSVCIWGFGETVILTGESSFLVAPVSFLMNHWIVLPALKPALSFPFPQLLEIWSELKQRGFVFFSSHDREAHVCTQLTPRRLQRNAHAVLYFTETRVTFSLQRHRSKCPTRWLHCYGRELISLVSRAVKYFETG